MSLLVDHRNAQRLGVSRAIDAYEFAVQADRTLVSCIQSCQDLDEGGLSRSVLTNETKDFSRVEVQ